MRGITIPIGKYYIFQEKKKILLFFIFFQFFFSKKKKEKEKENPNPLLQCLAGHPMGCRPTTYGVGGGATPPPKYLGVAQATPMSILGCPGHPPIFQFYFYYFLICVFF
jgi:hypothetical protein